MAVDIAPFGDFDMSIELGWLAAVPHAALELIYRDDPHRDAPRRCGLIWQPGLAAFVATSPVSSPAAGRLPPPTSDLATAGFFPLPCRPQVGECWQLRLRVRGSTHTLSVNGKQVGRVTWPQGYPTAPGTMALKLRGGVLTISDWLVIPADEIPP